MDGTTSRWIRASFAAAAAVLAIAAPQRADAGSFVISEVMYDPIGNGSDDQKQWIELYNGTGAAIDFSLPGNEYSVGWGRNDYLDGVFQLSGVLPADSTWLIGGPISDASNGNPIYDQAMDLDGNLRKGTNASKADGVALFNLLAADITATSVPIDAVIYGQAGATTTLIDETGNPATLMVATDGLVAGQSIEFWGGTDWRIGSATANAPAAPVPEPTTALLVMIGLGMLTFYSRRRDPPRQP